MNINNISFGKKIPQVSCMVYDKRQGENIKATICEYDCKDDSDIEKVSDSCHLPEYTDVFIRNMHRKHEYPELINECHFYTLEDENEDILGLMQCNINKDNIGVALLESNQSGRYRNIGTVLLSSMAKQLKALNKNRFIIINPVDSAMGFYINKCGFRVKEKICKNERTGEEVLRIVFLEMNGEEAKKLIGACEKKTQSKLIDLTC